ncbi:hypothetical protein [Archangium sp.]|uniref:hypothetical protein n=1 Tax=Archangium sp. TaxID=1872627 RepID=UPI00286C4CC8|nr:hypothetical protein [Archangium sp.]
MKTTRIHFLLMALVTLSVGCGGEFEQEPGTQAEASSDVAAGSPELGEKESALCDCIVGTWSDAGGDVIVQVGQNGEGFVIAVTAPYARTWPVGSRYWWGTTDAPATGAGTYYNTNGYGGRASNGWWAPPVPMKIVVSADKQFLTESASSGYSYTWHRI